MANDYGFGLAGMAGGTSDALSNLMKQRVQMAQLALQQRQLAQQGAFQQQTLAQQDALTRLKVQELADAAKARAQEHQQAVDVSMRQHMAQFLPNLPLTGNSQETVDLMTGPGGVPKELFPPQETQGPAPIPPALAANPDEPPPPATMPGTIANSPQPMGRIYSRVPTPGEAEKTRQQSMLGQLMPTMTPEQQKVLLYEQATGRNAPAALTPKAPAHRQAEWGMINGKPQSITYDPESGRRYDASGQDVTARVEPVREPKDTSIQDAAALERSYNARVKDLNALITPARDKSAKIADIQDLLSNPTGESMVAPKLLSLFVGGQGSGLKMTNSEINRVTGGAGNIQTLESKLKQWSLDPASAGTLTAEQKRQVRQLAEIAAARTRRELDLLQQADADLVVATSPTEHKRIVQQSRQAMGGIVSESSQPVTPSTQGSSRFQELVK